MFEDAASTIVDGDTHTAETLYEVTIACELLHAGVLTNVVGYTFTTPGPSDPRRMLRAACFFDNALFKHGPHEIFGRDIECQRGRTGAMFAAMKAAYGTACGLCKPFDPHPVFYIVKVAQTNATPLVISPVLIWLATKPTPVVYPFRPCLICGRVQERLENVKRGVECCVMCARSDRSGGKHEGAPPPPTPPPHPTHPPYTPPEG